MKITSIISKVGFESDSLIREETESGTIIWRYGQERNYDPILPVYFKIVEAAYQEELTNRHLKLLDQVLPKMSIPHQVAIALGGEKSDNPNEGVEFYQNLIASADIASPNSDVSVFSISDGVTQQHFPNAKTIEDIKEAIKPKINHLSEAKATIGEIIPAPSIGDTVSGLTTYFKGATVTGELEEIGEITSYIFGEDEISHPVWTNTIKIIKYQKK